MDISTTQLEKFVYSQYFYNGMRRAIGIMLPIIVLGGLYGHFAAGLVATFGSLCVALIDQPGPWQHRGKEMLGGALLSTLTVAITGLASSHPILIWLVVIGLTFFFSMLSVYGKKGGLIGFACLLLMTVTMHAPLSTEQVWMQSLFSLGGGLFYTLFSYSLSRILDLREQEQALSVALFATADYIACRGRMYDTDNDLDTGYRNLIFKQSDMIDKHQAARDMVLRGLRDSHSIQDPRRIMIWNLFIDMLSILDTLVATHTDYSLLRQKLDGSDAMIFMRDTLYKMSLDLERIALAVSRERTVKSVNSTKAELRALEFEIEQFRAQGFETKEPDAFLLCVQILRRLRNSARVIERMAEHTRASPIAQPLASSNLDNSLSDFLSRQQFRIGMMTSNLRLDSPTFRYALRVTVAVAIAMTLGTTLPGLADHGYWIVLTILVIMKPGFALTRQRNAWRLTGTLIGCVIALLILHATHNESILLATLGVSTIIGASLLLLNFLVASVFNTVAVLIAFDFIEPMSTTVIWERAIDTLIGSAISFGCSFLLPSWESKFMTSLARAAVNANRQFLQAQLSLLDALAARSHQIDHPDVQQAELTYRLARKNVHIAFSNFAQAFYRMMLEPQARQAYVAEYNNLLIQNHMMASQISGLMPLLQNMREVPHAVRHQLDSIVSFLDGPSTTSELPPIQSDTLSGAETELIYPLKQLQRSTSLLQKELAGVSQAA